MPSECIDASVSIEPNRVDRDSGLEALSVLPLTMRDLAIAPTPAIEARCLLDRRECSE